MFFLLTKVHVKGDFSIPFEHQVHSLLTITVNYLSEGCYSLFCKINALGKKKIIINQEQSARFKRSLFAKPVPLNGKPLTLCSHGTRPSYFSSNFAQKNRLARRALERKEKTKHGINFGKDVTVLR